MVGPAQTPRALVFTLLGCFELRMDGREAAPLPRKARALLAYLAMQDGTPVSRETVADLLWTDRGAEQARHSLRQTLLVLRRVFGPASDVTIRNEDGALALTAETDAIRLRALAGSEVREELAEAARLYRGPFLHDFPPIARDFDEWLARMRAQMADHAMTAMGRLADHCIAARDWDEAVATVERMLALDPLREDVHRRMIEVCARAGRRSEALRHYQACVEILRRELEVSPSSETEALVRRVRAGDVGTVDQAPARTVFAQPAEGPPWIAVLPFRAIGPDPVPGYFAEGLVEDTVTMLAALREPIVVSSNSSLVYRDRPVDLRTAGRELGVRYVVSGSLRRVGSRLRITAELAEAETGMVVWKRAHDTHDMTVFDTQDHIVAQIVNTLVPRINEAELRRARVKRPENLTAYDLVLQAREMFPRLDPIALAAAGRLLEQAIALDAGYAAAHAAMAAWFSLRIGQGLSADPAADTQALEAAATAANECDPTNAQALALLAHNKTILRHQHEQAQALFDRALDAAPNDASVWMLSSPTYAFTGDAAEAVRRGERALRLSPLDPMRYRIYNALCIAHYTNGAYDQAAHWGRLSLRENPDYLSSLRATAAALVRIEADEEARCLGQRAMKLQPGFRVAKLVEQHPYRDRRQRESYGQDLLQAGLPL